jgi:hypothetical protein
VSPAVPVPKMVGLLVFVTALPGRKGASLVTNMPKLPGGAATVSRVMATVAAPTLPAVSVSLAVKA